MKIKSFILVTTALLAIPAIADCRPSASYSKSSGSISAGTRSMTSTRSISNYGSSGSSARNAMDRIGSKVSDNWFSKKSAPPIPTPPPAPKPTMYNTPYPQTRVASAPVTPPPPPVAPPFQRPQSSSDNFISSVAGSYIGTSLANANNHSSNNVASAPVAPAPSAPVQQNVVPPAVITNTPQPTVEVPQHHSHIIFWFFILLLSSVAIAGGVYYFINKDDDSDKTPTPKKEKSLFYPGMTIKIDPLIIETDPSSKNCPLHFEADAKGIVTIVAVSHMGDIWHLYLDEDMNEFVRLYVSNNTIQEARFFSYINQYPIGTSSDMDEWIGNGGIIGSSVYMSEDQIRWNREVFPDSDKYISPETEVEDIILPNNHSVWKTVSCMYTRKTGFDMAYAQDEYLLMSFLKGYDQNHNPVSYVKMWAGVDIPVSSLNLI